MAEGGPGDSEEPQLPTFRERNVCETNPAQRCFPVGWTPIANEADFREVEISPGTFQYYTRMAFDSESLQKSQIFLKKALDEDHECIHNIINIKMAMIEYKRLGEKSTREVLRSLPKLNETNNLNTLANLEILYRRIHLQNDAQKCRQKMQSILHSKTNENKREEAICLLEQGYTLLFGKFYTPYEAAHRKLKEANEILSHSEDKAKVKEQTNKICLSLARVKENDRSKYQESVELLERGLMMLGKCACATPEEIIIWKYFLTLAYQRLLSDNNKKGNTSKRAVLCKNIVLLFEDVINCLRSEEDKRQVYIARSYAHLGKHLHCNPKDLNILQSKEMEKQFEDIETCLSDALDMKPEDTVVLTEYAQIRMHNCEKLENQTEKLEILKYLEYKLGESLKESSENWFLLKTMSDVRKNISKALSDPKAKRKYLKKAYKDSLKSYREKPQDMNCVELAKICQSLAKHPNEHMHGKEFVKHLRFLDTAVENLCDTYRNHGITYYIAFRLASCLADKGESRYAVEWMKRAFILSKERPDESFKLTCIYLIVLYKENKEEYVYLFYELLLIVQMAETKVSDISYIMSKIVKTKLQAIVDLFQGISNNQISLSAEHIRILQLITRESPRLQGIPFKQSVITHIDESDVNSEFHPSMAACPAFSRRSQPSSEEYEYDFFISHSSEDSHKVVVWLLNQLETQVDQTDVSFKCCYADRDFTPGKPIVHNIYDAIEKSCKILMVLTPNFVESRMCKHEITQALSQSADRIIPILFEDCDIPRQLRDITYLDMTDPENMVLGIEKLKRLLTANNFDW